MSDDEPWDANPNANDVDDDDLDDDWDIDSEEEREKARKAEEEKQKLKSLKQKMKERDEAERRAKEARMKEMNRIKTAEEIEKEQEEAHLAIAADMLGMGDDDDICSGKQSTKLSSANDPDEINLLNMKPKTKKDFQQLSDMMTKRVFEFESSPEFKYFLDTMFRSIANKIDEDNYQTVMDLGKAVNSIGNNKQQEWKRKNKKTKNKTNKPTLGKSQTQAQDSWDTHHYDDYDDFM